MPKSFVAVLSLAVGLLSSQVLAETYTYNGGDVTQATSFSPEGTPGAGDTILIPAETDLVITSSTPGWNAVAALGSSGHVVPLAATSRLVLNVAEAESVDFTVPFTAWKYKSYFYEVYPLGVLVKRGLGEVTLAFGGGDAYKFGDGNCCYTLNRIVVEEGTLTTDTTGSCTYLRLYGFEVAQGATGSSPNLGLLTTRGTTDSGSRLGILVPRSVPLLTRRQRICRLSSASIPRRQARSRVGII